MILSMGVQMKLLLIEAIECREKLQDILKEPGIKGKKRNEIIAAARVFIESIELQEKVARAKLKYLQEIMRESSKKIVFAEVEKIENDYLGNIGDKILITIEYDSIDGNHYRVHGKEFYFNEKNIRIIPESELNEDELKILKEKRYRLKELF